MSAEYTTKDNLGFDAFWAPLIHGLSDEMAGKLIKALLDYHFTGKKREDLPRTIQPLYDYMIAEIEVTGEEDT